MTKTRIQLSVKITVKTPNQYADGYFRLANGGNFKRIRPEKIAYWVEKAIMKALLASHTKRKSSQVAVRVIYGGGMENETLDSRDFDYLFNTTVVFLEDYISKRLLNKTRKYNWTT